MSGIFNAAIFNNTIFNTGTAGPIVVVEDVVKTGTGGIDPGDSSDRGIKKRKTIYKPTGLVDRKKEKIEELVVESRQLQKEVYDEVIGRHLQEPLDFKPIQEMTSAEVDREIAFLMKEKLKKEDEDDMMLVMMIAAND